MLQGFVSNVIRTAAIVLAAHHRFMNMQHATPENSIFGALIQKSDLTPEARLSCDTSGTASELQIQKPRHRRTSDSLQHSSEREMESSKTQSRNFEQIHQVKESLHQLDLELLHQIKAAVPALGVIPAVGTQHSYEFVEIMSAIGCHFRDFMDQLTPPAVNLRALRLKGHQHVAQVHTSAHTSSGAGAGEDNEREEDIDYLSAMLANTYLCQWLQLGQQGSADFQRTVLTCEGLAVNFINDHGTTTDVV